MSFVLGLCLGGGLGLLLSAMARAAASDTIRERHDFLLMLGATRPGASTSASTSASASDSETVQHGAVNTGRYAVIEARMSGTDGG